MAEVKINKFYTKCSGNIYFYKIRSFFRLGLSQMAHRSLQYS